MPSSSMSGGRRGMLNRDVPIVDIQGKQAEHHQSASRDHVDTIIVLLYSAPLLDILGARTRCDGCGTGDSPAIDCLGRLAKACCSWPSFVRAHPMREMLGRSVLIFRLL